MTNDDVIYDDERWRRLEELLRRVAPGLITGVNIQPGTDLYAAGLDSLGTVALLVDLEDEFQITIPDEALTVETFGTPAAIMRAVAAANDSGANYTEAE